MRLMQSNNFKSKISHAGTFGFFGIFEKYEEFVPWENYWIGWWLVVWKIGTLDAGIGKQFVKTIKNILNFSEIRNIYCVSVFQKIDQRFNFS